ncbi:MAG: 50S ribosomal protein L29 [Myxococcota bacterium]
MKASEMRDQSAEELENLIKEKEEELFKLRFQHHTGQLENVARLKVVRREIARAKTVQAQRQEGEK